MITTVLTYRVYSLSAGDARSRTHTLVIWLDLIFCYEEREAGIPNNVTEKVITLLEEIGVPPTNCHGEKLTVTIPFAVSIYSGRKQKILILAIHCVEFKLRILSRCGFFCMVTLKM